MRRLFVTTVVCPVCEGRKIKQPCGFCSSRGEVHYTFGAYGRRRLEADAERYRVLTKTHQRVFIGCDTANGVSVSVITKVGKTGVVESFYLHVAPADSFCPICGQPEASRGSHNIKICPDCQTVLLNQH